MKKALLVCVVLALTLSGGIVASVALSAPPAEPPGNSGSNPGSPGDDCSHGNSGKDCKPDPQPGHGQECDDHGNAAGDEDHCLGTTTTTPPPPPPPTTTVTTTTTTPVTTSTSSTSTSTSSTSTVPSTTTTPTTTSAVSPVVTPPVAASVDTPKPTVKPKAKQPSKERQNHQAITAVARTGQLPYTGSREEIIFGLIAGGLLIGLGVSLRRFGTAA